MNKSCQRAACSCKSIFCGIFILFGLLIIACQSEKYNTRTLPKVVDFNFHIKPILSDRCFKCHGPDANTREGNLRLDTKEGAFALVDTIQGRYAIVPGNLKNSLLSRRISSLDPEIVMPPPESNLSLSDFEIALINRWIEQGAEWKSHWAFISPQKTDLPRVQSKSWPENEIDYFILARLEQEKLKPEPSSIKEKWLRRVSFDLTGLPPSSKQIDEFIKDESDDAYEKIVDILLANDDYGERMASVWLDIARYADSHGYQDDRPRTMWPWRDWVINAFNKNLPYDQFVKWQLAGDLMPDSGYEQKLTTGFNRNHPITQEGGVVNEEYITEYAADRTNTASTAFLGLTMECARCHDHKYDPISQKDYYSLFAFFNVIEERGQINYFDEAPEPNMMVEDEQLEKLIAYIDANIITIEDTISNLKSSDHTAFQSWLNSDFINDDFSKELTENLVSYHRLDHVASLETKDEVAAHRPGRMNTGLLQVLKPMILKPGKRENSLEFDGRNFLNLGDIADFDWYHPFSLGAWIWSPGTREKDVAILVKRNGEQKRGGHELVLTRAGQLTFGLIHDQNKERIEVHSEDHITARQWTHIFATYDGSGKASGIRLYINGKLQKTIVQQDNLERKSILNGNDLLAGNWTHRSRIREDIQGFKGGRIDEIRIYNREISPLEAFTLSDKSFKSSYQHLKEPARLIMEQQVLKPHFLMHHSEDYSGFQSELLAHRRNHQTIPEVMIMKQMDTVRASYILNRGAYDAPGDRVYPDLPSSILTFSDSLTRDRLGLADWITHPDNPLSSRVIVNRLWQLMFGKGIVATSEDFGSQGALPTHPELLDWLAVEFVQSGWDIKALLRKIALSATYRQSSVISAKKLKIDPGNLLLSRGPDQRLSAEMIRDQALFVSGLLVDSIGGKWVKPYQPKGIWKELANQIGENKYRAGRGDELYRRSLYWYWKRTIPPPAMLTFDAAERAVCTVKRQATTTPLQSLILLNDPQYIEASRHLAIKMIQSQNANDKDGLKFGFRQVTSRWPTHEELKILENLLEIEKSVFVKNPEGAKSLINIGDSSLNQSIDEVELAAWTQVANTLLNLDEAKMKS